MRKYGINLDIIVTMVLKYSTTLDWTKDSPSLDLPKPAPNVAAT